TLVLGLCLVASSPARAASRDGPLTHAPQNPAPTPCERLLTYFEGPPADSYSMMGNVKIMESIQPESGATTAEDTQTESASPLTLPPLFFLGILVIDVALMRFGDRISRPGERNGDSFPCGTTREEG